MTAAAWVVTQRRRWGGQHRGHPFHRWLMRRWAACHEPLGDGFCIANAASCLCSRNRIFTRGMTDLSLATSINLNPPTLDRRSATWRTHWRSAWPTQQWSSFAPPSPSASTGSTNSSPKPVSIGIYIDVGAVGTAVARALERSLTESTMPVVHHTHPLFPLITPPLTASCWVTVAYAAPRPQSPGRWRRGCPAVCHSTRTRCCLRRERPQGALHQPTHPATDSSLRPSRLRLRRPSREPGQVATPTLTPCRPAPTSSLTRVPRLRSQTRRIPAVRALRWRLRAGGASWTSRAHTGRPCGYGPPHAAMSRRTRRRSPSPASPPRTSPPPPAQRRAGPRRPRCRRPGRRLRSRPRG